MPENFTKLLENLLNDPVLPNYIYYPPVDEANKLHKKRIIQYHNKNKVWYDS